MTSPELPGESGMERAGLLENLKSATVSMDNRDWHSLVLQRRITASDIPLLSKESFAKVAETLL